MDSAGWANVIYPDPSYSEEVEVWLEQSNPRRGGLISPANFPPSRVAVCIVDDSSASAAQLPGASSRIDVLGIGRSGA